MIQFEPNNNKAVIYARYSSDKQNEQSIEGQIRVIKEYADRNNIPIIDSYIDRAITGRSDDRPEFQRMIDDSKKKQFGYVLVYKFDRFSRDRLNSLVYKRDLKKNGVKVTSVTEYISDDPQGILFESIIDGYSEFYSAELAQKVRRGNRESRLKGQFTGGPILYGYKIIDKKYVIDEDEAAIVRKIFTDVGNLITFKHIAAELNDKGIKHRGQTFRDNYIGKVIKNERYYGKYVVNGEEYPGLIPPIISEEIYKMANNSSMINKNRRSHFRQSCNYLLSGKVYCGYCGEALVGESGTSKDKKTVFYYYACKGHKKKLNDCKKKNIRKEVLEKMVVDGIKNAILQSDKLDDMASKLANAFNESVADDPMIEINKKAIIRNKKELENVMNAIKSGLISESIKEELAKLEKEKQVLEDEKLKLAAKSKTKITEDDAYKFLLSIFKFDTNDENYNKMLIERFVRKVLVFDDKLEILLYPLENHAIFDIGNNNKGGSGNTPAGGNINNNGTNGDSGAVFSSITPEVHHLNNSSLRVI